MTLDWLVEQLETATGGQDLKTSELTEVWIALQSVLDVEPWLAALRPANLPSGRGRADRLQKISVYTRKVAYRLVSPDFNLPLDWKRDANDLAHALMMVQSLYCAVMKGGHCALVNGVRQWDEAAYTDLLWGAFHGMALNRVPEDRSQNRHLDFNTLRDHLKKVAPKIVRFLAQQSQTMSPGEPGFYGQGPLFLYNLNALFQKPDPACLEALKDTALRTGAMMSVLEVLKECFHYSEGFGGMPAVCDLLAVMIEALGRDILPSEGYLKAGKLILRIPLAYYDDGSDVRNDYSASDNKARVEAFILELVEGSGFSRNPDRESLYADPSTMLFTRHTEKFRGSLRDGWLAGMAHTGPLVYSNTPAFRWRIVPDVTSDEIMSGPKPDIVRPAPPAPRDGRSSTAAFALARALMPHVKFLKEIDNARGEDRADVGMLARLQNILAGIVLIANLPEGMASSSVPTPLLHVGNGQEDDDDVSYILASKARAAFKAGIGLVAVSEKHYKICSHIEEEGKEFLRTHPPKDLAPCYGALYFGFLGQVVWAITEPAHLLSWFAEQHPVETLIPWNNIYDLSCREKYKQFRVSLYNDLAPINFREAIAASRPPLIQLLRESWKRRFQEAEKRHAINYKDEHLVDNEYFIDPVLTLYLDLVSHFFPEQPDSQA